VYKNNIQGNSLFLARPVSAAQPALGIFFIGQEND